jgi:hypothetical protein
VLFDMPSPTPSSGDIRFYEKWKRGGEATNVSEVVNNWWKQIRTFK